MRSPASQTNNEGMAAEKRPAGALPARILLVDDDPVNQMVALGLLRRHGWHAVAAGNGKEALQILATQTFNLILMDLQMPEMDGFQTATAIRLHEAQSDDVSPSRDISLPGHKPTDPQGRRIPIIALTTTSQPGVRERCLAAGMDDYLTKPINSRTLYTTVEKHLASPQ